MSPGPARRAWTRWAALAAVSSLVSCANAPQAELIALPYTRQPDSSAPAAAGVARAILVVRRLAVPEYMRSRPVRYWADPETLAQWPDAYWAERIEVGMTREFTAALRGRLPGWTICDASCGDAAHAVSLTVDLLRLDLVRGRHALLTTAQIGVSDTVAAAPSPTRQEPLWNLSTPVLADSAQGEAQAIAVMLDRLAERAAALAERAQLPAQAVP